MSGKRKRPPSVPLTAERLRELMHYDPVSGIFTWRPGSPLSARSSKRRVGKVTKKGYVQIGIDYERYLAHRLAWLYMTGEWPLDLIDHRNLQQSDNRWANLRPADYSGNATNRTRRRDNKSGCKGVSWHKQTNKWTVNITHKGTLYYLGLFTDIQDAREAYLAKMTELHGEYGRAA